MVFKNILLLVALGNVLCACSHQQIYSGIRDNRLTTCSELNGAIRDQCFEQYEESYAEFKQRRDEQLSADNH